MEFKNKKELINTLIDYISNKGIGINFSGYIFKVKSGFSAELHRQIYLKDGVVLDENFNTADETVHRTKHIEKNSLIEFRFEYDAHCRDIDNDYWRIDQSILALRCEPFAKIHNSVRSSHKKDNLKFILDNKLYDELEA